MNLPKMFLLLLAFAPPAALGQEPGDALQALGTSLAQSIDLGGARSVAVVEFISIDGRQSAMGKYIAEELTTALFGQSGLHVFERSQLERLLVEQNLQFSALTDDPKNVQRVGKLLGVDALVVGTYADMDSSARLNLRVVSVATGQVIAAKAASIPIDAATRRLLMAPVYTATVDSSNASPPPPPVQEPFTYIIDFSKLGKGQVPNGWGGTENFAVVGSLFRPISKGVAEFVVPLPKPIYGDYSAKITFVPLRNNYLSEMGYSDAVVSVAAKNRGGYTNSETLARYPLVIEGESFPSDRDDALTLTVGAQHTLHIRREGTLYNFSLNSKEVAMHRVKPFGPTQEIRISLGKDLDEQAPYALKMLEVRAE